MEFEETGSLAAMKELIQYFEKHGQRLDRQDLSDSGSSLPTAVDTKFVSCIRFSGIPILPPVMTNSRCEEARCDRHSAVFKEKQLKARQRKQLMARVSSLTENPDAPLPGSSGSEAFRLAERSRGSAAASRPTLERPPVLKPVVTSAWASHSAPSITASSIQSVNSESNYGMTSQASTFATIEQLQPATEDFGLQTLDSVSSEFLSLEETLPTDFNGLPLTSLKQQKISYDLTRLSRVLGVKDFNSTGESDASELPFEETRGEIQDNVRATSALDTVSASFCHESQDTVVEAGGEQDSSTDASPAETSGSVNTSGMSSANTTGTADSHRSSRSSPRSFRSNTVHFASFVTEYIDNSASLSSENITVVKKKMPFEGRNTVKKESEDQTGENKNLLANVSLIDSIEICLSSSALPQQTFTKSSDTSSDKENDARQANRLPEGGNSADLSESRLSSMAAQGHHGVTDSQGSSRSTATSESSNSTLIEDASAVAVKRESSGSLPPNIMSEDSLLTTDISRSFVSASVNHISRMLLSGPNGAVQNSTTASSSDKSQVGAANLQNPSTTVYSRSRGHVRRGSYTLSEPSPALVRAQGVMAVGASGEEEADTHRMYKTSEDHTKPVNVISVQPVVPSDPESKGKAEHISRYLSQVQLQNSEDVTASQADLSHFQPAAAAHLQQSLSIMQSLQASHSSIGSAGSGEELMHKFQTLRHSLLEQQQQELEEMFVQQRREQMVLQAEFDEHQRRMKEQQEFLTSNAPENIKHKSHTHEGELSPDCSTGNNKTETARFDFPAQPQSQGALVGGVHRLPDDNNVLVLNASSSPKVYRPVLRSPVKFYPGKRFTGRVVIPSEAYEPEMRGRFEKLSAVAKGFLCRRLLYSDKVQELVKTVKDTREFAFSFQSETPIRKGTFNNQDRTLLERIVAQLQAALLDIHEIFFNSSIPEQMALIEQTRLNHRDKMMKSSADDSLRSSAPRISLATIKAQERRRRAMEAESAVFGTSSSASTTIRHHSTLTSNGSPRSQSSIDLSGPLKRHYQSLLIKSMKPVVMAAHHAHYGTHQQGMPASSRQDVARLDKVRPQSVPDKQTSARPKKPASVPVGAASSNSADGTATQPKLSIRPKQPPQQPPLQQVLPNSSSMGNISKTMATGSKSIKTSSKSWR